MQEIQNVLNDEESMKQIKELAGMLTSGADNSQANNNQASGNQPQNVSQPSTAQNNTPDLSALMSMLGGMNNNQNQQPVQNVSNAQPNFDMNKIMKFSQIMQSVNKPDNNVALLLALRPLLRPENQVKIDRLVKLFKLFAIYPLLKDSGLGGDLLGIL